MKAAWYQMKGPARDVLRVGDFDEPQPLPGEVRVRVRMSAVNPSDTKTRSGLRTMEMPHPVVIPHQDGAGEIDLVGDGVDATRIGERVWVYEANLARPFGTAAQYTTVPAHKAVALPDDVDFDAGACLGIPVMTAHRCVFADGPVSGQTILVQGGAGAVGYYAIQAAKIGGAARVIATVSRDEQAERAHEAGADLVIDRLDGSVVDSIREVCDEQWPLDRVIEVAFGANLTDDIALLRPNGVIATYASDAVPEPAIPFWSMLAKDLSVRFVLVYAMSDQAHAEAVHWIDDALRKGLLRHQIHGIWSLDDIAAAHEATEAMRNVGKVLVRID